MSTWSCKATTRAFLLLAGLAGCSAQTGGLFSAQDGPPPRPDTALESVKMARGAVRITPPEGYCVDKRGLRQTFAILARCDSLGSKRATSGAPLGFIAVSVAPLETPLTAESLTKVPGVGTATLSQATVGAATIFHLSGPTPPGTDPQHWKGVLPLGDHAVALSAYGPPGGALSQQEGGDLLARLAQRTEQANAGTDAQSPEPKPSGGFLSGLLD